MSGLRFGGRVPMYAEDSDLDEPPRHSRLQGMLPSRHGGKPHTGNDGETSDLEEFPPRTRHHSHRPSRHGGRVPGSRFGHPNMFGPQGLGSGIADGGFGERELALSPRGHRRDHRAGHGPRGMPDLNLRGLRGDFGDDLGTRHPGGMRGFDARDPHGGVDDEDSDVELRRQFRMDGLGRRGAVDDPHGGIDDEDSDAELRRQFRMDGPGRRGAVDEGRRGHGRRGTMEHGREDFGLEDLELGDRGHGGHHGPSRRHGSARHGHREHRDMDGHGANERRHGRH